MRLLLVAAASLAVSATLAAQQRATTAAAPRLDDERFAELQALLTPDATAGWRTIPWRIDLLAAQREASKLDRPLFVWAMDGHPLGCT
ncbi:MAG: hypothetical protein KAI24_00990 [Planctomycetes bacterium]|nr:hypothetical protein [Planctomycetota bacterium]